MTPARRRTVAGMLTAVVVALLATASSAFAHATLIRTTPPDGAVLKTSPRAITLNFSEPVETEFGSLAVYDGSVRRVDTGRVERPSGNSVRVELEPDLPEGTYTVVWRIVSADSHPVHGAFVVHVGKPGAAAAGVASRVGDGDAPSSVSTLQTIARIAAYAALLLTAGGAGFLAIGVGTRFPRQVRTAWTAVAVASGALVLAALALVGLQGASAAGRGPGGAVDGAILSAVSETRYGRVWLGVAAAALVLGVVALLARRDGDGPGTALRLTGVLFALPLVVLPSQGGHPHDAGTVAEIADVVHLAAAALWVGGLAVTVLILARAGDARRDVASWLVPRFSGAALVAAGLVVVAGAVSAWRLAGGWDGLVSTTHGKLVIVKVALVVGLLALGAANRAGMARLRDRDDGSDRRLMRIATVELALMATVVVVAAVLVSKVPGRAQAAAASGPVSTATTLGPYELDLTVDPARQGQNVIHLYTLNRNGRQAALSGYTVSATQTDEGIGPITMRPRPAGPGHVVIPGASFPIPGRWVLTVGASRGTADTWTTDVGLTIGAP